MGREHSKKWEVIKEYSKKWGVIKDLSENVIQIV